MIKSHYLIPWVLHVVKCEKNRSKGEHSLSKLTVALIMLHFGPYIKVLGVTDQSINCPQCHELFVFIWFVFYFK